MKPIRFEGVYDPTIWKPVEGAEGYFVNMEGKVKGRRGRVLKQQDDKGYCKVCLSGVGHKKVHRLVAEAFIGNIPEGWVVNHIDYIRSNNSVCNLEICSQSYNIKHSQHRRKGLPKRSNIQIVDVSGWALSNLIPDTFVSEDGRVASLSRWGDYRILNQHIHGGYYCIQKVIKGVTYWQSVHRLVAEAFLPNTENLPIVNHLNENKLDNRVENLEWTSAKGNCLHGTKPKRISAAVSKGVIGGNPFMPMIYADSITSAGELLGKSGQSIGKSLRGDYITAYGYTWEWSSKVNLLQYHSS